MAKYLKGRTPILAIILSLFVCRVHTRKQSCCCTNWFYRKGAMGDRT